jgi:hypothetical protein
MALPVLNVRFNGLDRRIAGFVDDVQLVEQVLFGIVGEVDFLQYRANAGQLFFDVVHVLGHDLVHFFSSFLRLLMIPLM